MYTRLFITSYCAGLWIIVLLCMCTYGRKQWLWKQQGPARNNGGKEEEDNVAWSFLGFDLPAWMATQTNITKAVLLLLPTTATQGPRVGQVVFVTSLWCARWRKDASAFFSWGQQQQCQDAPWSRGERVNGVNRMESAHQIDFCCQTNAVDYCRQAYRLQSLLVWWLWILVTTQQKLRVYLLTA